MDIGELWNKAITDDPHIIDTLTDEQIKEMSRYLDTYGESKVDPTRIAAISYTNVNEQFARRLAMTSLVGYLFQVLHEWEVPAESRKIVLDPAPVKNTLTPELIVKTLEPLVNLARGMIDKEQESIELRKSIVESELLDTPVNPAFKPRIVNNDDEIARGMFIVTRKLAEFGREAALNYKTVYDNCKKHKRASEELAALRKTAPTDEYLPKDANTIEIPQAAAKAFITEFVKNQFEFDPSEHVRTAKSSDITADSLGMQKHDPAAATPEHLASTVQVDDEHKEVYKQLNNDARSKSAVVTLLQSMQCQNAIHALTHADKFRSYLYPISATDPARTALDHVPPADTFHRLTYYSEVNYEKLRNITEALYPERPYFDFAIALWETFEADTAKDAANMFDMHCQRNKSQFRHDVVSINYGTWTMLGNFGGNRERVNYYNGATDILKKIEERAAADSKHGASMMKKRVEKAKAANIARDGPDAEGLAEYRKVHTTGKNSVQSSGAAKVIDTLAMKRLELARGNLKVADDLKVIDDLEAEIIKYRDIEAIRTLTPSEEFKLKDLEQKRTTAIQLLDVPDNAEQIDVFRMDGKTGQFEKRRIFVDRTIETPDE